MAKIAIELTARLSEELSRRAERLGVPPNELARAVVVELLSRPDDDFLTVARRVLSKHDELYRRLR
jgi:hypothetical protein